MIKAFIFDFDGVMVNSEITWRERESAFLPSLIGEDVFKEIEKDTFGSNIYSIFEMAKKKGSNVSEEDFYRVYKEEEFTILKNAPITNGVERLIEKLLKKNIKMAIVSSTAKRSIESVLQRISQKHVFEHIISLEDRTDLNPKPSPAGYLEAMKLLDVTPLETVILEDSGKGVTAAKASGAFVICFTEFLPPSKISDKADMRAKNMQEVIEYIKNL